MDTAHEDIRVAVIHGPAGSIRPIWFDLNRKQYRIHQITNRWRERRGRNTLLYFHVTDAGALYELVYDLEAGRWSLRRLEVLE